MYETRSKILKVAYHQFRKNGYHNTGLNQILSLSDVGKGQLYHYFSSKEELLIESLYFYSQKVFAETSRFMHDITSIDQFEELISGSLRLSKSQNAIVGCFIGNISGELSSSNEPMRKLLIDFYQQWKNLFVDGLEQLKLKGILSRDAKTEELAEFFLVSVQGAFLLARTNKDLGIIERSIQKSLNYIRSYAI